MGLGDTSRLALVAAGGAAGAFLRWQAGLRWPVRPGAFPLTTFVVNVTGAALLGYLVGRVPATSPRREAVRLALGTGVLGGFTTFSTFAVETARLPGGTAAAYAVASVVAGVVAAVVGLAAGAMAAR
jgi:CrcB protein